jgi:L-ascorbate metabolism protein UlaG (beta-lactamase superfamily)
LPEIDAVLISHDHYDHLNKRSIRFLHDRVKRFLVPLGVGSRLVGWGIPRKQIVELDWWETYRFDQHLQFVATPAQHFSGRGLADRNKTLWASWVLITAGHRVYFSGDSGYFEGFKQIGDHYGPFDVTFIECGAYNEAWHGVHLFPEETVQAHRDLRGNLLHPIHWGTFNLSVHAWYEPMQRLARTAAANQIKVATPIVGQTTVWGHSIPTSEWWQSKTKATDPHTASTMAVK